MFNIYITPRFDGRHGEYFDITDHVSSCTVDTEENKGFSTCQISIDLHNSIAGKISSVTSSHRMEVHKNGELVWAGRVRSLQVDSSNAFIEGEGLYSILDDIRYNDGSEESLAIDIDLYETSGDDFFQMINTIRGVAVEMTNTLGYDAPVKSFSMRLKQVGDIEAGKIIPFYTNTMTQGSGDSGHIDFMPIEAKSVPKDGFTTFEMRMSNNTDDVMADIVIPDGSTFYVGIKPDSDYLDNVSADNHIQIERETSPTESNSWHKLNDGNWYEHSTRFESVVYSRGKWDYIPGAPQTEIIQDIVDTVNDKTTLTSGYQIDTSEIDTPQNLEGLRFPLGTTCREAIIEVLNRGLYDGSSSFKALRFYNYSSIDRREQRGHLGYVMPIKFGDRTNLRCLIDLESASEKYNMDFGEIYNSVRVIFTDALDGFKAETVEYYTGIDQLPTKEFRVEVNDVVESEADIIAQLYAEIGKKPRGDRNIQVTQDDVISIASGNSFPIYRIRAGDVVGVKNNLIQNPFNFVTNRKLYTEYFVRKTSYNVIEDTMTLDLARVSEEELLIDLLT